jgi:hypothetical protein
VSVTTSPSPPTHVIGRKGRPHKVFGHIGVVREYNLRKKTFFVKYYKNETSKHASNAEKYTKEEYLEELHDEELHDEEPYESGDDPTPALLDAEELEEAIDTLTACLATLSQNY